MRSPPSPTASAPTSASASHYAQGVRGERVRSLALIVAFMAVIFFAVARTNTLSGPPVDVSGLATSVARETGTAIRCPPTCPTAGARVQCVCAVHRHLMTWHVGYTSPDGHYIAVERPRMPPKVDHSANQPGAGQRVRGGCRAHLAAFTCGTSKTQNSLVAPGPGSWTTIVTGDGTLEELKVFAEHLQPFRS